jgi:PEP-CTERM motif
MTMWLRGMAWALAGFILLAAGMSKADPITVTYGAAGTMTPNAASVCGSTAGCTVGYETFSYATPGTLSSYTSNFSSGTGVASVYSGVYSPIQINAADQYGGAGGTGNYDAVFGTSNTLTVANTQTGRGINYFGIWISALDSGNELQFYNGGTLVYTFTSQNLITALGSCANGNAGNAYCGNPSDYYADSGEQFAYVNFVDTVGTFNKIVFTQTGGGGFESDNQAVAYNSAFTTTGTPEPASILIMGAGLAGLFWARRRLFKAG